ncbi:hypothetical protein [Aquabacterium parvum]|jgi:hypothetical protein|uniref:hypothetical protein n=1 Tax=Aquabacterium parvum TaxID=70584 RepID=UPI000718ADC4|nr:hypothetical protein [Aquabacterium parvum]MBU0916357.1 hypothetical protein [Gammaproteobacteria bacterium]
MSNTSNKGSAARSRSKAASGSPTAPVDATLTNLQAAPWGQVMGDVMQLWLDQVAQGQRTGLALVDSQMRLWQDMQANATRLWTGGEPQDLHVMPDSAGPVLCPPLDFTPAGLTRSTLGTLQAIGAAWSTAVQHELQDLNETSRARH